jgi:CrcB protein
MARHGANSLIHQLWPALRFPLATLVVNVLGCCVLGVLAGLAASGRLPLRSYWPEFVFVGVLGGFTTFSTFGLDTITLIRSGETIQAVSNVAIQLGAGLGGVFAGLVMFEKITATVR